MHKIVLDTDHMLSIMPNSMANWLFMIVHFKISDACNFHWFKSRVVLSRMHFRFEPPELLLLLADPIHCASVLCTEQNKTSFFIATSHAIRKFTKKTGHSRYVF